MLKRLLLELVNETNIKLNNKNIVNKKQQKILFVDASLLNQSDCWRKIYYQLILGRVPKDSVEDFKMAYGTAFHKFLSARFNGKSFKECLAVAEGYYSPFNDNLPEGEFRTLSHLIKSCRAYVETYDK